ncbi:MAG: AEC family transporter [Candidatus Hodarchaeales archaeon]
MAFLEGLVELLSRLIVIYLVIIIGIFWRFSRFYKPEYGKWTTNLIVWVLFPINIISSFANMEIIQVEIFIFVVVISFIVHGTSYISFRLLSRDQPLEETGSIAICTTFPNALLFPFPIILAILGDSGLVYATLFVFIALVLRNTFGVLIGFWHNPEKQTEVESGESSFSFDYRKIILDSFKFPPFLAVMAGLFIALFNGSQIIRMVPGLDIIKNISLYGALLLVGISFNTPSQFHPRILLSKDTMQVAISRFFVVPLITLCLFLFLRTASPVAITIMIQAMAPPAVSNIIYGKFFNFDDSKISILITSLTIIALLLLPFELLILLVLFPIQIT